MQQFEPLPRTCIRTPPFLIRYAGRGWFQMDIDTHAQTAEDKTLTPDDAIEILEDILPAQIKSYNLGLKLKIPLHAVKAIHAKHQSTEDHLREVIEAFLNGVWSEPTWRVIINAVRSPSVNLQQLADEIENNHGFVTEGKKHTSRM